jgi:hypothetical protein
MRHVEYGNVDDLERMGLWGKDANQRVTVHGFRATFSTWANELGIARPDVIEAALAHQEADRVRKAYNRAEFLGDRCALMNAWGDYLAGRPVTRADGSKATNAQVLEFPASVAADSGSPRPHRSLPVKGFGVESTRLNYSEGVRCGERDPTG